MTATATSDLLGVVFVPVSDAIVKIDLADNKQMVVVTDHDSKVLAPAVGCVRRRSRGSVPVCAGVPPVIPDEAPRKAIHSWDILDILELSRSIARRRRA